MQANSLQRGVISFFSQYKPFQKKIGQSLKQENTKVVSLIQMAEMRRSFSWFLHDISDLSFFSRLAVV